jgi:hypothetical protein
MTIGQEVEMLRHEVANRIQIFPPPINDLNDLEDIVKLFKRKKSRGKVHIKYPTLLNFFIRKQAQQTYKKCVIDKVIRELWSSTTRNNRLIYNDLCKQINSKINN